jgi:hypothetical protein
MQNMPTGKPECHSAVTVAVFRVRTATEVNRNVIATSPAASGPLPDCGWKQLPE